MKIIKDMRHEMDVYIVGHVSYDRKDDIKLHDDNVEIRLNVNGKTVGKLRTDGNVQVLNTQQFRVLARDIFREKDEYPDDFDVIKVTNSEPSKIKLGLQGCTTLSSLKVKMDEVLSEQGVNLEDLFIEFSDTSNHFGILSLQELLEDELVD